MQKRTCPASARSPSTDCVAAKFDLTLTCAECDGRLEGWFVYDTDLFDSETVSRIAGHFQRLLESIAATPGQPVSRLSLLSGAGRRQLLIDWNATDADYPAGKTVHALFAEQVRPNPRRDCHYRW